MVSALIAHPLAQFGTRRLVEKLNPVMSEEDHALGEKLNDLASRRDFAGMVQLEGQLLRLVRQLQRDYSHTAGVIVLNLVTAHEHLGNDRRAQELRERRRNA